MPITSSQEPDHYNFLMIIPLTGVSYGSGEYMAVTKESGLNPFNPETDEYYEYESEQYDQPIEEINNLGHIPYPNESETDSDEYKEKVFQWVEDTQNIENQITNNYENTLNNMLNTYGNYNNIPEENKTKLNELKEKHDQINQLIFLNQ